MTAREELRQKIDEAIARIDAKLATASDAGTASDENGQLDDERLDLERVRSEPDGSESA